MPPPGHAQGVDCRTTDTAIAEASSSANYAAHKVLSAEETTRAIAYLDDDKQLAGETFDIALLVLRRDRAVLLIIGKDGCLTRWMMVNPMYVPPLMEAVEGKPA